MPSATVRLLVIALLPLTSACSTAERETSQGAFIINDTRRSHVPPKRSETLRSAWKPLKNELFLSSKVTVIDRQWALDFIANLESEGPSPCRILELTDVQQLSTDPFRVKTTEGKSVAFQPSGHLEQWTVDACGKFRRWRLLNEATDKSNPFRILLWDVG